MARNRQRNGSLQAGVSRSRRVAKAWRYVGPGSGVGGGRPSVRPWRGTSDEICGMWPLIQAGAPPEIGAPMGPLLKQAGFLCADNISWFRRGLISAPSAMVLALNGLGKSSLVRRIILGTADEGVHAMILGDIKPDYVKLIRLLGGQVITIGHGKGGINPLDAGDVEGAARLLGSFPAERAALLKSAHQRKKQMVLTLMHIQRGRFPGDREQTLIDEAITLLEKGGGKPALVDLLEVVRRAPRQLRDVALDRESLDRYRQLTEELEVTLQALLRGSMGEIFASRQTTPMMMDRSVVFDVSSLQSDVDELQAAVLLACWGYGFATVEIAQTLADVGVMPRQFYNLIMDEIWRTLQVSPGMVDRIQALTRLNRTVGIGQLMVSHSMADFNALPTEEDRIKAAGLVERSKLLFLGGLPRKEMPLLEGVMPFSQEEKDMMISWAGAGTYDQFSQTVTPPAGMGKFLLKFSDSPGYAFSLQLSPEELELSEDSNSRWDRAVVAASCVEKAV